MEMTVVSEGDTKARLMKSLEHIPSKVLQAVDKSKFHLATAGVISLVVLCCLATSFSPEITYNPLKLWNSDVLGGDEFLKKYNRELTKRQSDVSLFQYLDEDDVTGQSSSANGSILTRAHLLRHIDMLKQLLQTNVRLHGIKWDFQSICSKVHFPYHESAEPSPHMVHWLMSNMNPCLLTTALDCFWDGASLLDATSKPLHLQFVDPGKEGFSEEFILMWKNSDLIRNRTYLEEKHADKRDTFAQVSKLIDEYGMGDVSYLSKPCLQRSNCMPWAKEVHSATQIVATLSHSVPHGCPSFIPRLHNSSLDVTIGSISRTADGRLVSARQLHSILHVMNGAQFHAAMLPQMQALHVPWNMQKAEQVLHTFYTKFQKTVERFNAMHLESSQRKKKDREHSSGSKFWVFSVRNLDYEQYPVISGLQLILLAAISLIVLVLFFCCEKFFLKSSHPLPLAIGCWVNCGVLVAASLSIAVLLGFRHVSISGEILQVLSLELTPIVVSTVVIERLLLEQIMTSWVSCVSWPSLHLLMGVAIPSILLFIFYPFPVLRASVVCAWVAIVVGPILATLVALPLRASVECLFAKYKTRPTTKTSAPIDQSAAAAPPTKNSCTPLLTHPHNSDEDSRSQSDKRGGKYSELYKIGSLSASAVSSSKDKNESSGDSSPSKSNKCGGGGEEKTHPKGGAGSVSLSPSSSGNKVSLYELGIPQSYIRPTKRKRKSRHFEEGSRGGGVTSVTTCFNEDNKFHGHTNGGTSKGGLVKRRTTEAPPTSPDTVNERSKAPSSKRAASVEHKSEPASTSPESSPKERDRLPSGAGVGRGIIKNNHRRTSSTVGPYGRTKRSHYRTNFSKTSTSSSSCCRSYYEQYCQTLGRRQRRHRRITLSAHAESPTELSYFTSEPLKKLGKWFLFCSSKQYQVSMSCLCVLLFALSCYTLPNMESGLRCESDLVNQGSSLHPLLPTLKTVFKIPIPISVAIESSKVDIADPKVQRELANLDTSVSELLDTQQSSSVQNSPGGGCWISRMKTFLREMQNAYWEFSTKNVDEKNITREYQMAQVLALQPRYSEHATISGLVDSSGIISPHSFYSLLTSWNNWDLFGIFTTQPGFVPPTPFMPAFQPISQFVTPAERLQFSVFHYHISSNTRDVTLLKHKVQRLIEICMQHSHTGIQVFPTGDPLFAWAQFFHFNWISIAVISATAISVPAFFYLLFRRFAFALIMLLTNVGQIVVTLALCTSVKLLLSPLSVCVLCLNSAFFSAMSAATLGRPAAILRPPSPTLSSPSGSRHPIRNRLSNSNVTLRMNDFYSKMLLAYFLTWTVHILMACSLLTSQYAIISKSVLFFSLINCTVGLCAFVTAVPAALAYLTKCCQDQQSKRSSTTSKRKASQSFALEEGSSTFHSFPYSSSWDGVGNLGVNLKQATTTDESKLNSSSSFLCSPFVTPQCHSLSRSQQPPDTPWMPAPSARRPGFLASGTLTRREKLRLQRSYIRNQQFLALALDGRASSRNSISNASYSPRPQGISRTFSTSSHLQGHSPPNGRTVAGCSKLRAHMPTTVLLPSTCSTERKFPHARETANEEHDCYGGRGLGVVRSKTASKVDEMESSLYPQSIADTESDFLLMRSPSQIIFNESEFTDAELENSFLV